MANLFFPESEPKSKLGHYRTLSPLAGIRVSPLQLGGGSIGERWAQWGAGFSDKASSFKVLDTYFNNGGNFLDSANHYHEGDSERFIGEWAESRGIRDQLVIATKYTTLFVKHNSAIEQKVNFLGTHKKSLRLSLESSLKNLRTNYVDILYVHMWDYNSSVEEVMNSLHEIVLQGKVLYLGISDTPTWVVAKANQYARDHGKTPFVIYQGLWSILDRSFERDIIPMARSEGLALAPFGVLGQGRLRSKQEDDRRRQTGENGRTVFLGEWEQTADEKEVSAALEKVANEVGAKSITSVAIAYVLQGGYHPFIRGLPFVFPIIGSRKAEQLEANLEGLSVTLSPSQIKYLESVKPLDVGFPHYAIGNGETDNFKFKSGGVIERVEPLKAVPLSK